MEEGLFEGAFRPPIGRPNRAIEWESYPIGGDGGIDSLCTSADFTASAWRKAKVPPLAMSNNLREIGYSELEWPVTTHSSEVPLALR
jgi:hypothetical protein